MSLSVDARTVLASTLVRAEHVPMWLYTGALSQGQAYARATCQSVEATTIARGRRGGQVHQVVTVSDTATSSATSDTEEEAWRVAIGSLLSGDQPYCDFARPGESVADLLAREPDAPGPPAYYDRVRREPGDRALSLMAIPTDSAALAAHPVLAAADTAPSDPAERVPDMYAKAALVDYAAIAASLPPQASPDTHPDTIAALCDAVAAARSATVPLASLRRYRATIPAAIITAAWDAATG